MISYYDLKIWVQVVLLTAQFIALCMGIYLLTGTFKKRAFIPKVLILLVTAVSGGMLAIYSSNVRSEKKEIPLPEITEWLSNRSALIPMLVTGLIIICFIFYFVREYKNQNNRITRSSIKESVDKLPAGLCFYYENGRCVLINHCMNSLCYSIVGRDLQNAALFWQILKEGEVMGTVTRLDSDKNPTFRLADGSVWSFTRKKIKDLYQLSAVEITQIQQITDELKLKKQDLDYINQRLRKYGENVDELTRANERLEIKANIHRSLGQALLVNRKFVLGSAQDTPFAAWETIVAMLRSENVTHEEDSLAMFTHAAKQAGIELKITGSFPEKTDVRNLFVKAAVESLVNAVRHAEATTLFIELSSKDYTHRVRFSNNGKIPEGNITEGGGLGSLRRKVNSCGGEMIIETNPEFALIISIPCERSGENA